MSKANEKIQIHLSIDVESVDYEKMSNAATRSKLPVSEFLNKAVSGYISGRANGGLMLSGVDIDRIKKTTGSDVSSPGDIVALAEKGVDMKDGKKGFYVDIDPSLLSHAEELSSSMGISVQEFVDQCWSFILANGWLHEINPDAHWIPFSVSHVRKLKEVVGDNLNSDTIISGLKKK